MTIWLCVMLSVMLGIFMAAAGEVNEKDESVPGPPKWPLECVDPFMDSFVTCRRAVECPRQDALRAGISEDLGETPKSAGGTPVLRFFEKRVPPDDQRFHLQPLPAMRLTFAREVS